MAEETWLCNLLEKSSYLPDRFVTPSIFCSDAPEINHDALSKEQTSNFRGCSKWYEVGLQMLSRAGWRPDCSRADAIDLDRVLPPQPKGRAWIAVRAPEAMEWTAESTQMAKE